MNGRIKVRRGEALPRPCKKCGKRFQPKTRWSKICDTCRELSSQWRNREKY